MKKHDFNIGEKLMNLQSPNIIVPEIIRLLGPKSVVDVGCGLGTFIHCLKREGVEEILGVDGPWFNKELLFQNISPDEFYQWDLKNELILDKKYDLVISLEVANHLPESLSDLFVRNLINAGGLILFSSAVPYQGGPNQVNLQWLSYWKAKFNKYDYVIHDVFRPLFWENPKIEFWYKQNMVLIAPKDFEFNQDIKLQPPLPALDIVHPDFLLAMAENQSSFIKYYRNYLYTTVRKILE